ncbi:MAG: GTPase HflX [Methanomassiliicoccales archaeon]
MNEVPDGEIIHEGIRGNAIVLTISKNTKELEDLIESAGYRVYCEVIQRRNSPEASTFLGRGKLESVKALLSQLPADLVVVNGDLKPAQQFNLERELKIKCIDRVGIVLEIFANKARSKEAKLQVERARLKYEIPFIREWIHRIKIGERAGHFSGGEYEASIYYDLIRRRVKKIDDELKELRRSHLKFNKKEENNAYIVSLAGYTNAGKSSLFSALTNKDTVIDEKMFSTLRPLSARIRKTKKNVILIDTIGFLDNLPVFLIESFKNTIDDIFEADLVLLVVDISESVAEIERKINASMKILLPQVDPRNILLIGNKTDKLDDIALKDRKRLLESYKDTAGVILTSAKDRVGVTEILNFITNRFGNFESMSLELPYNEKTNGLISWLSKNVIINDIVYSNCVSISFEFSIALRSTLMRKLSEINVQI